MAGPHEGSLFGRLSKLEPTERLWIECAVADLSSIQRRVASRTRMPKTMRDRRFSTSTWTAISSFGVSVPPAYLVCIERTE